MQEFMDQPAFAAASGQPAGEAVLVSGASFAGLATACCLNRLGYRVTVIEAARAFRTGGTPVDMEGDAIGIAARMGMIDAIRAKALPPRLLEFKDAEGCTLGVVGDQSISHGAPNERFEIHREDMLQILSGAIGASTELIFGRSISRIEDGADDVAVTFDDGTRRRYALVFGCDGNRSNTRRLVFGEGDACSYFMGCYFYIKVVPMAGLIPAGTSQIFSVPGRTALLNGYSDRTDIALAFRTQHEIDYDYRDRAQQRRMVHDHFDGLGWQIPAVLRHVDADDSFYFDKVNQIRMPAWSKGRVALVGDAGYCVSPVAGMGGSMAIIGAARLAEALQRHGRDHAAAFREYDDTLRPFVNRVQEKAVSFGMATMFPSDEAELAARNRKLREGALVL